MCKRKWHLDIILSYREKEKSWYMWIWSLLMIYFASIIDWLEIEFHQEIMVQILWKLQLAKEEKKALFFFRKRIWTELIWIQNPFIYFFFFIYWEINIWNIIYFKCLCDHQIFFIWKYISYRSLPFNDHCMYLW